MEAPKFGTCFLPPKYRASPRPPRGNWCQTLALPSQPSEPSLPTAMANRPRSPKCPRFTKRRSTCSVPPRRRRLPSQVHLASRHQSRQLRILDRPHLRQRIQILPCPHRDTPMPHQANPNGRALHQSHAAAAAANHQPINTSPYLRRGHKANPHSLSRQQFKPTESP